MIAAGFLWGAVPAIILSGIIQLFLMWHLFSASLFYEPQDLTMMAVIVAPISEESVKAVALLVLFLLRRKEIDSLLDGLVYGAAVGFGFAAVENIFYFLDAASELGFPGLRVVVVLRTFVFGTNHAIFTGLTGLGFALARFSTNRAAWLGCPLLGLLLAILMHGLHNLLAVWSQFSPAGNLGLILAIAVHAIAVLGIIAFIITSLIIQRRWVRYCLEDEVQRSVLTQSQADAASSFARNRKLSRKERRLIKLSVELAMKKHAYSRVGDKGQSIEEIELLRKRVGYLSSEITGEILSESGAARNGKEVGDEPPDS